jgi:RNA polymerase sigma-70 factor (ECF subfamily)
LSPNDKIAEIFQINYGRLLAYLASIHFDLSLVEDSLQDAFLSAIKHWTERGIPDNPQAWLFKTAKNKLIDKLRFEKRENDYSENFDDSFVDEQSLIAEQDSFPDERLKLLYVCAHPAIDRAIHTPLMLQTVFGFSAEKIAKAFVTSPATMSQRLVRAKNKIKENRIPFKIPMTEELPQRLESVLNAIYVLYSSGWDCENEMNPTANDFSQEAIFLARLIVDLCDAHPETLGLLSLILFCQARQKSRIGKDGSFCPFSEQDASLWSRELMEEAERCLFRASITKSVGRFQIEAAIQSAHCQAKINNQDLSDEIVNLYKTLLTIHPSLGAKISYASVLLLSGETEKSIKIIETLDFEEIKTYQPYWVVKAAIYSVTNDVSLAKAAYEKAISLSERQEIKLYLSKKRNELSFDMPFISRFSKRDNLE